MLALLAVINQTALGADDWNAALPLDRASLARMLQEAGPTAAALQTDHFVIVYSTSDAKAHDFARRLERVFQAHAGFVRELNLPARLPSQKLEVRLFRSYDEYRTHLATLNAQTGEVLGCFEPRANRCVFFDLDNYLPITELQAQLQQVEPARREKLAGRLERRRELLQQSIVQHEAAHQIEVNIGLIPALDRIPTWLTEGLATLFEAVEPGTENLPASNAFRLFEFKKRYATAGALGDVRHFLADDAAWCGADCYPLAWAITRFLQAEYPAQFARLLRTTARCAWPSTPAERVALLEQHFGPLNEAWISRLYAATMNLPLHDSSFAE